MPEQFLFRKCPVCRQVSHCSQHGPFETSGIGVDLHTSLTVFEQNASVLLKMTFFGIGETR